jgi:3',5'-cyclic AMP phosphodiesterase CpdA
MTQTLTFAHLSDPHLTTLAGVKVRDLMSKRIIGYLSWRFIRRREHLTKVLDALEDDLRHTRPDHVVITGDLTHLGLPDEFRQAAVWLHALGCAHDVTVIPGNHDAYVQTPWRDTYAKWWPYLAAGQALGNEPPSPGNEQDIFPTVQYRGRVAFIGLSTAVPSAPFLAVGSLGEPQLVRLEKILQEAGARGYCRIILIHHPPLPGAVKHSKRLVDSRALQDVLIRRGAELVLHGHTHRACRMNLSTPNGAIPVMGVPSASAVGHKAGHRAQYYLYRVTPAPGGWDMRVSIRGYTPITGDFTADGETALAVMRAPAMSPGVP